MSGQGSLAGKTALVTGAAMRLGHGVSLALAEAGSSVALHYNTSREEAEALAAELVAGGVRAWTFQANLRDSEEAEGLFSRVVDRAGPIDILVNNASIFPEDGLSDLTAKGLAANINVNALSPFLLSRAFAAQGREGCIVNFLDARIVDYDRNHVSYHLSKRMLFSLTRMMALEFAPRVRVNAVAPGVILPPPGKTEEDLERLAETNPMHACGTVQDVAEAVVFLLGSGFVTGQVIFVDGGRHMKGAVYG